MARVLAHLNQKKKNKNNSNICQKHMYATYDAHLSHKLQ